ncbi:efflux RND transporter periplasmic adaptor subunit [Wukongibacter baidiensis]|uniref:efflux RND transporter periplasmic adaptor subunit n=1 Tax=Wukongibacter baidiensis TaxID=1723361 RepID=UPI003D7FF355
MKKKIAVLLVAIILLTTMMVGCGRKKSAASEEEVNKQENYTPVAIEETQTRTISNEIVFSGKVHADKEVMILPEVPGKVIKMNGHLGTRVEENTVLFTLDKDDIQKQVEQARKAADASKANYQKTRENIQNAKLNLERTKELYEQGAVSKNQYEQAQLAASDASLDAVKAQYEQAQLSYQQALDRLKDTSVKSPISGIISEVNIEEGEMASSAQSAMTIIDMDKVYVEINVTENIINDLYLDQEVVLEVAAANNNFVGKIDRLSPAADSRTQLYPVRIYIENNEHKIKPGMFAKIKLNTDVKENVIAVKSEAVVQKGNKLVVYTVENDKAVEKEVTIGLDTGIYVEILKGLNKGESIIVKGQNYVDNGSIVKVVRGDK